MMKKAAPALRIGATGRPLCRRDRRDDGESPLAASFHDSFVFNGFSAAVNAGRAAFFAGFYAAQAQLESYG